MIDNTPETYARTGPRGPAVDYKVARQLSTLTNLLDNTECDTGESRRTAQPGCVPPPANGEAPWGMARGLFLALSAKHAPSAAHCLRVAKYCSSWAESVGWDPPAAEKLELSALLHEVGKLGLPDHLLSTAGKLSRPETAAGDQQTRVTRDLLAVCSAPAELLSIVWYAAAWFDGRRKEWDCWGEQLPRGARMLAIADAFDQRVSEQAGVLDGAPQAALAELAAAAGSRFDPGLVVEFRRLSSSREEWLPRRAARPWLDELEQSTAADGGRRVAAVPPATTAIGPFHEQLLENMQDGVVYFDAELRIRRWNRALESLTGISAADAQDQPWDPAILQMRDEHYKLIVPENCPVLQAVCSGTAGYRRLHIADAKQDKISVDAQIAPVLDAAGRVCGATLLLQDASSRVSLEERVQTLHEKSRQDGLTRVANRAELDRVHEEWVRLHLAKGVPYSMIICDLDHFKRVNDTYGHQAGDGALVTFAALLKNYCRSTDLVARYGGEEFVVLCPGCDLPAASWRAEAIREALAAAPQPMLDGKSITASFGVTELQPGDNPETILRRADQALLQAKNEGRNVVVQLVAGMEDQPTSRFGFRRWLAWLQHRPGQLLLSRKVITAVPLKLTVEKLRGFVADNPAQVLEAAEKRIVLEFQAPGTGFVGRRATAPMTLLIDLELREISWEGNTEDAASRRTVVHVTIRPKRQRDRRRRDADQRARQLLASLKSYLMAHDYDRLGK